MSNYYMLFTCGFQIRQNLISPSCLYLVITTPNILLPNTTNITNFNQDCSGMTR